MCKKDARKQEDEYTFKQAQKLFEEDCELRNLREHTIRYYRNKLNVTWKMLLEQGLDLPLNKIDTEVIPSHIFMIMKKKELRQVTINTRLRAIRAFSIFGCKGY
ncbi:site-specific integrase [Ectobacillus polymachus]|uniref:site-specific integrase n=1 Tax=Ectobacillus polymachus TaxID=1508806 RepID=UPI003A85B873